MKRIIGILLTSVYLLTFTEFHQLLKVPYLLEHFKKHQVQDPDITFIGFIRMHYVGPYIVTDDFTQDEQLPFRSAESHTQMVSLCDCVVYSMEIEVAVPPSPEFHTYNELNQPQLSSFDIFEPPRVA